MFEVVDQHVFPFLRTLGGDGSTYAHHMKDARFTIPTPALLAKVVAMIDGVPMEDRDTKGDLYEYMLGKIASAGQNGQFRTPRHIVQLMVELVRPVPTDIMCDPASGTCGFPWRSVNISAGTTRKSSATRNSGTTSTTASSTPSTSTTPCSASAA
jgi:type I restriction enzyme M protein